MLAARNVTFKKAVSRKEILYLACAFIGFIIYIVHTLRALGFFGNPRILWKFQEKTNRN